MKTTGNGAESGAGNGAGNGADNKSALEAEAALFEDVEKPKNLSREELKKLTVKKLAQMAKPYSKSTINTLERHPKEKLIDILQSKGEKQKDEEPKARATRSKGEFEQMVDMGLALLDAYKMKRDEEPNPMMIKELVKSQVIMKADEAKAEGKFDQQKVSNIMLIGSIAVLTVSTIGVDRIMGTGKKIFEKIKKKPEDKKD